MQMHSVETSAGTAICARAFENRRHDFGICRQIAMDIFDLDRGVVHQNADRQRQAAQRHDVDGFAQRAQHADRNQDRKRNRDRDNQRAAPASQEQQNHDRGQAGRDDRLAHHAADGRAHEDRLIRDRLDLQLRRQRRRDGRQRFAHLLHDIQRGGLARLS